MQVGTTEVKQSTELIISAYFTGIALILTAIGNLVISIRNGKSANTIIHKVDEVHKTTNSGLTDTKNELRQTQERVIALEKLLTESQSRATISDEVKTASMASDVKQVKEAVEREP